MRTCRALYRAGLPVLLRFVCIHAGWTTGRLASWCKFVLREERRATLIREMHLHVTMIIQVVTYTRKFIDDAHNSLAEVLKRARSTLRVLKLKDLETQLEEDEFAVLTSPLCELASLQRLIIKSDCGPKTQAMLTNMASPLVRVDLALDYRYHPTAIDPITSLRNFASSLETLHIAADHGSIISDHFSSDLVFSQVKQIILEVSSDPLPSLVPFMVSFPNLVDMLCNSPVNRDEKHYFIHGQDALDEFDTENRELRKRNLATISGNGWPRLEFLYAGVVQSYTSGLSHHVHQWRGVHLKAYNAEYFDAMIGALTPEVLQFTVSTQWFEDDQYAELMTTFPMTNTVKKLAITLLLDPEVIPNFIDWLTYLLTACKRMPPEELYLFLDIDPDGLPDEEDLDVVTSDVNFDDYAQQLAAGIPKLNFIALSPPARYRHRRKQSLGASKEKEEYWARWKQARQPFLRWDVVRKQPDDASGGLMETETRLLDARKCNEIKRQCWGWATEIPPEYEAE
ncbi:hypothetical protein EIP91_004153 [Steccherinum ochraceum]|uniref:F-box domain-containing protein n=1 Tax=Steccherinum ochraceum TaxID=92696 RepID=A0A4R0RSQ8_9APHY|nr:hypothetical protein EIP91_004153 [Steccherinum ochraceum]